jgi:hypothetical protein
MPRRPSSSPVNPQYVLSSLPSVRLRLSSHSKPSLALQLIHMLTRLRTSLVISTQQRIQALLNRPIGLLPEDGVALCFLSPAPFCKGPLLFFIAPLLEE